ncbi:MAG: hypothetical protein IH820_16855 [Bacteroidetes bacterium]|nr:hypothetical protein [Bacteroidota bacterium]
MRATLRALVPVLLFLGMGCATDRPEGAPPPSGRFAFALVGDTPYTEEEETRFLRLILPKAPGGVYFP